MSEETGRIVAVEIVRAGGTLAADAAAGATTLTIEHGWDFPEAGGTLAIGDAVYTYTAADYGETDDDPTVLTLVDGLLADAEEGDFVALSPERSDKFALVEVAGFDDAIRARIPHYLADRIESGPRAFADQETVQLAQVGVVWEVADVLGQPPKVSADYIDPDTTLPPQSVPGEGWEYLGNVAAEQIVGQQITAKLAIADELWVARYASNEEGEIEPAADSNVIHLSSTDGFSMVAPDGTPVVTFPTATVDEDGKPISAEFRGRVIADDITVLEAVTMQGPTANGFYSRIAPGAALQLDSVIGDPETEPSVSFNAKTQNWPGLTDTANEIGWGLSSGLVVQARHNSGGLLVARFIDPTTGFVDHSVDLTYFADVAGFTAGGGKLFVLGRLTGSADWAITRWNPDGSNDGKSVVVEGKITSASRSAISYDPIDDTIALVTSTSSGVVRITYYYASLSSDNWQYTTDIVSNGRVTGAIYDLDAAVWYIAVGNRVYCYIGGSTEETDEARSFWTYAGALTGFGRLPGNGTTGDGLAGTNQSGRLTVYNDDKPTTSRLYAWRTKIDTNGGMESGVSPLLDRSWPTRTWATVSAPSFAPGTDAVGLYASETSDDPANAYRLENSRLVATISKAPTTGDHPPAESEFTESGDPGLIASGAQTTGGEPLTEIAGNGDFHAYRAMQSGSVTVTIPSAGATGSKSVTFSAPFAAAPSVVVSVGAGTVSPGQLNPPLEVQDETATGFTVRAGRSGSGTSPIVVNWIALAKTQ